jgi:hypothetical protein
MRKSDFTVILRDRPELTDEMAEALYSAGCDDGTPGSCDGVVSIDFHRERDSLEEAIRSAIVDVRAAGFRVSRIVVEADSVAA